MPGPSLRALTSHFDPPEAREVGFSLPLAFLVKVPSYNICWPRLQCSGLLPQLLQHGEPSGLHLCPDTCNHGHSWHPDTYLRGEISREGVGWL